MISSKFITGIFKSSYILLFQSFLSRLLRDRFTSAAVTMFYDSSDDDDVLSSTELKMRMMGEIYTKYRGPRLDSWKDHVRRMEMHWNLIGLTDDDDGLRCLSLARSLKCEDGMMAGHFLCDLYKIADPLTPYKDVLAKFDDVFLPMEALYKKEFLCMQQDPNEPLEFYIRDMQANYRDWWGEDIKFLIFAIIRGIWNQHLRNLLYGEEFSSVQALQERALAIKARIASRTCLRCDQFGHLRANCRWGSDQRLRDAYAGLSTHKRRYFHGTQC